MSRRMAARYQSDMRRQRQLIFAAIAIVVLIVLVFAVGIYQSLIGPNIKTLASYGGTNVSSGDYFTYRKIVLYKELGQLQNISGSQAGNQQQQIQAQIQSISSEIADVQSFPIDQPTLERLVSNQLLEREAKNQYNITVSDADLNTGSDQRFRTLYPDCPARPGPIYPNRQCNRYGQQPASFSNCQRGYAVAHSYSGSTRPATRSGRQGYSGSSNQSGGRCGN